MDTDYNRIRSRTGLRAFELIERGFRARTAHERAAGGFLAGAPDAAPDGSRFFSCSAHDKLAPLARCAVRHARLVRPGFLEARA